MKDYVAIKIVRNIDKYRHAAMIELEVLNTLERNDPAGLKCVFGGVGGWGVRGQSSERIRLPQLWVQGGGRGAHPWGG